LAGRPKQGIDYAGWSVDIFDGDKKIDKLLDAKGWKGFGIYFFLCQRAYKTNGYYYEWGYDDCATTARKMGGGINSGTVKETVDYCLQVDLFDRRLFDEWGVLTSRGIQRRFWAVLSERRSKTVYQEYWLLKSEECKGLVKVSLKSDVQPTNSNVQSANDDMSPIKKSKVNNIYNIKQFSPELEQSFQTYLLVRKHNFGELIPEKENTLREELQAIADNDAERLAIVRKAIMGDWKSFYKTTTKKTDDSRKKSKPPVKDMNNFKRREYDMDSLENQLLDN
jgi:hypothetical protein